MAKTAETETGSRKYLYIGLVVLAVAPIVAKRLGVYAKSPYAKATRSPSLVAPDRKTNKPFDKDL